MADENLEVTVYSVGTTIQKLDVVPRRLDPAVLSEVEGPGSGTFTILANDPKIAEVPNLLDYRNVVKMTRGGVVEGAFIIQTKKETTISPSESEGESLVVSGEGLKSWFNDATVYPWSGLQAGSNENRVFSWASPKGLWYKPTAWSIPVKQWPYEMIPKAGSTNPWPYRPAEWPDAPSAWWIWSVKENHPKAPLDTPNPDNPAGYNYFRYEFDTTVAGNYSVFAAGDNTLHAYIDGENIIESDDLGSYHQSFRADFELQPGHHVLAFRVWNAHGPGALIASLFRAGDAASGTAAELLSVTGGPGWVVNGYPSVEPGWTIGEILLTLLQEAKARGIRFPSFLTPTFTGSKDSAGNDWEAALPWTFRVGSEYTDVLDMLEEFSADVWIDPADFKLYAWNKRGVDRTVQTTTAQPVTLRKGYNLRSASESGQADIKNTLMLQTNDGWVEVVPAETDSLQRYGRVEGQLSTNASLAVSRRLAKRVFDQKAAVEEGSEYVLMPVPGAWPHRDFGVGDWVLAPNRLGELVKRRVMSITATELDNNASPAYAVEFDTIFKDSETQLKKLLSIAAGGGLGGSFSNGAPPTSSVGSPTTTPLGGPIQSRPGKPLGLTATSEGKWNVGGGPYSVVTIDWEAGASSDQVAYYEVLGRLTSRPEDELTTLTMVSGRTSVQLSPLQPGVSWTFYVRASITAGRSSELSDPVEHVTKMPNMVLDAPSKPTLSTAYGTATIAWDGLSVLGEKMAYQFDYVYAMVSEAENGTYKPIGATISAAGTIVATDLTINKQYWFVLKAVDRIGIESVKSQAAAITIEGIDTEALEGEIRADLDSVRQAADDAKAAAGLAQTAADDANTKAGDAQTTADKAVSDALAASGLAGSKGRVIFQASAPTGANASPNNLWIRSSDNKPFTYNGTDWVEATDKVATDAAAAAVAAKAAADKAASDAAAAATTAGNAQTAANGKSRVWYQTTKPAGTDHKINDTWFDTDDGNKMYAWNGADWVPFAFGAGAVADGAITAGKLSDSSVTADKLTKTVNDSIAKGIADAAAADTKAGSAQTSANNAATVAANAAAAATLADQRVQVLKQQASSLIYDGGFELDFDGKGPSASIVVTNDPPNAHSGSKFARFRVTTADPYPGVSFPLRLTKDRKYEVTVWAKVQQTASSDQTLYSRVSFRNAANTGDAWQWTNWNVPKDNIWRKYTYLLDTTKDVNASKDQELWVQGSGTMNDPTAFTLIDDVSVVDVTDILIAQAAADLAKTNAATAQTAATNAATAAQAAQGTANTAQLAAAVAQGSALAATQAALDAAGLASDKGQVWFQPGPPDAGATYKWTGAANGSTSERQVGTVKRTNLALNGSFEASDSVAEIRRNLVPNPAGKNMFAWQGRWFGNGGDGAYSAVTTGGPAEGPATFVRKTWTKAPLGNGDTGFNVPEAVVVPGTTIMFSAFLRTTAAGKLAAARVQFLDKDRNTLSTIGSATQELLPNAWTRISLSYQVPAGAVIAVGLDDVVGGTIWAVGDRLDGTGALIETSSKLNPYFDGNTPGTSTFYYQWMGTEDTSAGVSRQVGYGVSHAVGANCYGLRSGEWSSSGTYSLRVVPYGASDSFVSPGGDIGNNFMGMQAGKTYTAMAKIRLEAAQTGTLFGSKRSLTPIFKTTNRGYVYVGETPSVPNAPGVTEVRTTFTVPMDLVNTKEAVVRLYNGASRENGDVFFDDFALIEVPSINEPYTGPFFDGSTPDDRQADLWVDTDDGNKTYLWNTTTQAWEVYNDKRVTDATNLAAAAKSASDTALSTANGKNKITYSLNAPSGSGTTAGDMWFRRNNSAVIVAQYEWNGSEWQFRAFDNAVIANLDAGKLTAGFVDADRIAANTITASKIAVADFTNYVPDPGFAIPGGNPTLGGLTRVAKSATGVPAGAPTDFVGAIDPLYDGFLNKWFPVKPGDQFYIEATVASVGATAPLGLGLWTANTPQVGGNNFAYPTFPVQPTNGSWVKISGYVTVPEAGASGGVASEWGIVRFSTNMSPGWYITQWSVRRKAGAELIVDGAITADKIAANSVSADKIKAGAISAANISVGDFTNLWPNPYMNQPAPVIGKASTTNAPVGASRLLDGRDHIGSYFFPVAPGMSFVTEFTAKRTAGDLSLNPGMWVTRSDGQSSFPFEYVNGFTDVPTNVIADLGDGWKRYRQYFKVTGNSTFTVDQAQLYFQIDQAASGGPTQWLVGDVSVRRRSSGELLVDGAITSDKLSANSVTAAKIQSGSVTTDKLRVGNFSNLATLDEENGVNVSAAQGNAFGSDTEIVDGWVRRKDNSGQFFMFTYQRGPLAFEPGDEILFQFNAKATGLTTVVPTVWIYDLAGNNIASGAAAFNISTTEATYTSTVKMNTSFDRAVWKQFVVGIQTGQNAEIQVRKVTVLRKQGTTLIADGAITTSKIVAGAITADSAIIADAAVTNAKIANLDAAKITTGQLDAARIAALSITADKIFVGNSTNILVGGDIEGSVAFGNMPSGRVTLDASFYHTGTRSLVINPGSVASTHPTPFMSVAPGDRITAGFWYYANSVYNNPSTQNRVEYQDQNGAPIRDFTFSSVAIDVRESWVQAGPQYPFTIPAGVTAIRAVIIVTNTSQSGAIWLDDFTIVKAGKGALVVDGSIMVDGTISGTKIISNSITADQIKANSITAVQIAAGTIEANNIKAGTLTTTQLAANSVLASNLAADAITAKHTITGALIRTAATGARTEMSSQGLRVVGADGLDKVRMGFGIETGMAVQNPGTTDMIPLAPLVLGMKSWTSDQAYRAATPGAGQGYGAWIVVGPANAGVTRAMSPTGRFLILNYVTAPINSQQNFSVQSQVGFYYPQSSMNGSNILSGLETQRAFAPSYANGEFPNVGMDVITLVPNRQYEIRPILCGKSNYGADPTSLATGFRVIVIPM